MKKTTYSNRPVIGIFSILALFLGLSSCCELSGNCQEACEENSTSTLIFENTTSATLQVFINQTGRISINGPGDVDVPPGEMIEYEIAAGFHNIQARTVSCVTNNGRTGCTTQGKPERNIDIDACEKKALVY